MTSKSLRNWAVMLLLVVCAGLASAQSDNSRLLELGRQHDAALQRDRERFEQEQAELQRRGDEQVRRMEALRKELERCGQCARRAEIQAELDTIERQRRQALQIGCAGMRRMGIDAAMCAGVEDPNDPRDRELRALKAAAAGGSTEAVYALASFYRNRMDKAVLACPQYRTLAPRGHDPSIAALAWCIGLSVDALDSRLLAEHLPGCAAREHADCEFLLARALSTLRHQSLPPPVISLAPDDRRALALWERAAARSPSAHTHGLVAAQRLHMGLAPHSLPPLPGSQTASPAAHRPGPERAALVGPSHLAAPPVYDNVGPGDGQVFVAEHANFLGVRVYIADPLRPSEPRVGDLEGAADLVLYDAGDLDRPVEIGRARVLGEGQKRSGLATFLFATAVPVRPGGRYFFAIEGTDRFFGLGLRTATGSTYAGGFQARLGAGGRIESASGPELRDAAFEVLAQR